MAPTPSVLEMVLHRSALELARTVSGGIHLLNLSIYLIYPHILGNRHAFNLQTAMIACLTTPSSGYPSSFQKDKHFGKKAYNVGRSTANIQTEIMTNGPVEAAFTVYADFLLYKSGVYQHVTGKRLAGGTIK